MFDRLLVSRRLWGMDFGVNLLGRCLTSEATMKHGGWLEYV